MEDLWIYVLINSLVVIVSYLFMWTSLRKSLEKININPIVRADGLTLEELYSVYKALFE